MASFVGQGGGGRRGKDPRPADPLAVQAALERTRAALLGTSPELPRVGRFEIRTRLGRGGMGVVYAAYDPSLDREVALKIVDVESPEARDRVRFEARAQARVSHPNIVPIFEVEDHDDQVAIAMEYMAGGDLAAWLAATRRSWRQIVSVFVAAGRGLAAAHAAGLVHGDFKPDNVLLDRDGVPRVADFGLARLASVDADAIAAGSPRGGTPGYLAPELMAGGSPTVASDQYAFAVSLFEATNAQRIPSWLARALATGLAETPGDRFASIDRMVDALASGLARSGRRRRLVLGGVTLAIGAVLSLGVASFARGDDAFTCDEPSGLDRSVDDAWRANVTTAFARSGRPFAAAVVDSVTHKVLGYRERLGSLSQAACHAAEADPALRASYADQVECFDQARTAVSTLAGAWVRANGAIVDRAAAAVDALPVLEHCASTARAHRAPLPASVATRAVIATLEYRLIVAATVERSELVPRELDELRSIVASSERVGYAPLVAAAQNALGQALVERFDPDATTAFEAALLAASQGRDDMAFASAGIGLWTWRLAREGSSRIASLAPVIRAMVVALGDRHLLGQLLMLESETGLRAGDGKACLSSGETALTHLAAEAPADPQGIARARLQIAACFRALGDPANAKLRIGEAEHALREAFGPLHPDLAEVESERAMVVEEAEGPPAAEPLWREAIARAQAAYGQDNDVILDLRVSLAGNLMAQGRFDDADTVMQGVEQTWRTTGGRELAKALDVRGQIAVGRGELGKAIAAHEEAAQRFHTQGDLVSEGNAVNALGNALRAAGRLSEARAAYQHSLELIEQLLGADHARVAIALSNLGEMALLERDFAGAETFCRRALAIDEAHMAADNPALAYDLTCLGSALVGHGAPADSLPLLERALTLRSGPGVGDLEKGQTHLALARALWTSSRSRAQQYARLARTELVHASAPAELAEADKLVAAAAR